jgi:predicted Zn-dependent protease
MAAAVLLLSVPVLADRTRLKPGWNMFTPQQDIEIGQRLSVQAERQLPMLRDARVEAYIARLGSRLAAHAPGYRFPYRYRVVNDRAINAFALPGGFVYVNRGAIEAADTEAQLASVLAHETAHVALRHGTNQATKAYAWQIPAALLGGLLGQGSGAASVIAQLTAGFALNSIFLHYSREDETQADVLGAQILYDAGYDPRAMAQFFEKIQALNRSQPIEFFSDHPSPEHRVERVLEEVDRMGGPPPNAQEDSAAFHDIRAYLKTLPPAPARRPSA